MKRAALYRKITRIWDTPRKGVENMRVIMWLGRWRWGECPEISMSTHTLEGVDKTSPFAMLNSVSKRRVVD